MGSMIGSGESEAEPSQIIKRKSKKCERGFKRVRTESVRKGQLTLDGNRSDCVHLWVMGCESCWAIALVIVREWTRSGMNLEGKKALNPFAFPPVVSWQEDVRESFATVKEEIKTNA